MDPITEAKLLSVALDYVLPLIQLGMNHDEIRDKVQGWADSGMTFQQISDELVTLRNAKRDAANQATS